MLLYSELNMQVLESRSPGQLRKAHDRLRATETALNLKVRWYGAWCVVRCVCNLAFQFQPILVVGESTYVKYIVSFGV